MSIENIVEKILSDGEAEARSIVEKAEHKAAELLAAVSARAQAEKQATETDTASRVESILEKRAADARLESAKIMLREKRDTLDAVYKLALGRLRALEKEDCIKLFTRLLEAYAETGDTVYLAESFAYEKELSILPIVAQRNLRFATERIDIDGGMKLVGEKSDKDLSFGALLTADKEENQAALAMELFAKKD